VFRFVVLPILRHAFPLDQIMLFNGQALEGGFAK
jgi:hypothetical protein